MGTLTSTRRAARSASSDSFSTETSCTAGAKPARSSADSALAAATGWRPISLQACITQVALLAPPPFDVQVLAALNRPGTPWLDAVMKGASSNIVLLAVAALTALYLWQKSPYRVLAAVLLGLAIGGADLVS